MQIPTVYACVRLLAESIAALPLHLYRVTDDNGNKEKARDHPLYKILYRQPNPEMTSFVFWETLMTHLLLWGNAYAQIVRDGKNTVLGLYPLLPENVEVDRDESGELYYIYHAYTDEVPGEQNKDIYFRRDEIFHVPGLGFNGLIGFSPIAMMKNSLGKPLGLLAETGGAKVGVTAAQKDAVTFDEIFKLYYALKAPYRKKAQFLCNEALVLQLMTIKDNNGNYIWKPGLEIGKPDTLLNRPLKTSAFMPEIKGGSKVMAFGDYSYYWVADRQNRTFRRLNELYARTDQVGFLTTQRVDGKLILPEAVQLLQMAPQG